ncbi:MAG: undecaprenyl-diphosphate phosphatase [Acutalibacteraceae bacterium]|nr:undecaprenyl-diphosphate phosphatase [Acutalibacteraceae bacterium]
MLDIIKSLILGFIEGITEWLPISSTGHLKLAGNLLALDNVSDGFTQMFDYVIQLGAILAVVVIFWNKLWPFTSKEKGYIKRKSMMIWAKVIVAMLPAAIAGILLDDWVESLLVDSKLEATVISATLIIYGILFIVVESINAKRKPKVISMKALTYRDAILIGLFQVLSIIPGTSRSGATILGAIILGVSRTVAAEFSFFLAVPVIAGASLLKILKFGFGFTGAEFVILAVGMVSAFVVSILAIKFLLGYIKKKDFKAFGYYRIVLGLLVLGYFWIFA